MACCTIKTSHLTQVENKIIVGQRQLQKKGFLSIAESSAGLFRHVFQCELVDVHFNFGLWEG